MNDDYMAQVRQAFEAFGVTIGEAVNALGKMVQAAVDAFAALYVSPMRGALTWYVALNWAKRQYPEWVAIMNRTKKRRVRQKYKNRILRAYKEVVAE